MIGRVNGYNSTAQSIDCCFFAFCRGGLVKTRALLLAQGMAIALVHPGFAQVVPNQTLSVGERSQVSGDTNIQIEGGATRDNNLFHSLRQFSIPTGGSAAFNNAPDIANIITRITGNNVSDIDGNIRANGPAS
jgi:large exoprotein involved in heme utilization and adhesion